MEERKLLFPVQPEPPFSFHKYHAKDIGSRRNQSITSLSEMSQKLCISQRKLYAPSVKLCESKMSFINSPKSKT